MWLFLSNSVTAAVFRRCTARWSRFWGSPSYFLLQHMSLPYKGKQYLQSHFLAFIRWTAIVANKAPYPMSRVTLLWPPLPVSVGKRQIHTFAHRKQVLGKCWIPLSLSTQVFSFNKLITLQLYPRLLNSKCLLSARAVIVHLGGKSRRVTDPEGA